MYFDHIAAPIIHPTTGETISDYRQLLKEPALRKVWEKAFGKEIGGLAQGDTLTGAPGTNTIFFLTHEEIAKIPKDRVITYARIVVDFRPQKEDPNRVRITAGGNLINYPGELTTRTADLTTAKIMWNSVVSTPGAKYACFDIKNFYLGTPLDRYEYMKMPIALIPAHIIKQYKLIPKSKNGYVYMEIRKGIYGLPQAGILANKLLKKILKPHGYYEVPDTPGLFKHVTRPIQFTLVVDDFGVKYVGKQHAIHLTNILKQNYESISEDWDGGLYCGVTLRWNYKERYVDISMPGYVNKVLQRYKHEMPTKPQHSPYPATPRIYGKAAQDPLPPDTTPLLPKDEKTRIQQIVGSILYYARAVDNTVLTAINHIGAEQAQATKHTASTVKHLLDYLATHPVATIRYYASPMILNVHSDAAYLVAPRARSRASGHFFLGWLPENNKPIRLNGAMYNLCELLKFVAGSAAEAELGALFLCGQKVKIFRRTLEEMGHPQPPTPIHCDNTTAVGIATNTVKRQRSRAMEMRYFWVADQVAQRQFDVQYHPGKENLADYGSKHHPTSHHIKVRPYYQHTKNSPRFLYRVPPPRTLRGCVGTSNAYAQWDSPFSVPQDRVPRGTTTDATANVIHTLAAYASNIRARINTAACSTHKLI